MNKEKFLERLKQELKSLSKNESEEILLDYEEHFDLGMEAGKTEEEIANSLGNPNQIAKEILGNYQINSETLESTHGKKVGTSFVRMFLITLMLIFINLSFVIWIFITVALLIFSAWLVIGAFITAPVMVAINTIMNPMVFSWFDFFISLAMCGGGYFLGLLMWRVTKFGIKVLIRYVKFNSRLMKGE